MCNDCITHADEAAAPAAADASAFTLIPERTGQVTRFPDPLVSVNRTVTVGDMAVETRVEIAPGPWASSAGAVALMTRALIADLRSGDDQEPQQPADNVGQAPQGGNTAGAEPTDARLPSPDLLEQLIADALQEHDRADRRHADHIRDLCTELVAAKRREGI